MPGLSKTNVDKLRLWSKQRFARYERNKSVKEQTRYFSQKTRVLTACRAVIAVFVNF